MLTRKSHKRQKDRVFFVREKEDGTKYLSTRRKKQSSELKHESRWTSIPRTLKILMLLIEKIEDWNSFSVRDVERITGRKRSSAKGFYYTLISIQSLKRAKQKTFYIQQKTLKKLVTLFKAFNGRNFTWQDIRFLLKRKFEKCSRPTAKRFEHVMKRINKKMPAA